MKTPLVLIPLAICYLTATAAAQDPAAPVSDALRSIAKRAGTNLVAAAEEMPAGKYGFKPTPAQMSFGDVIAHLSGGNDFLCSSIAGVAAPKRPEIKGGAPEGEARQRAAGVVSVLRIGARQGQRLGAEPEGALLWRSRGLPGGDDVRGRGGLGRLAN